jgi:exodeoxyribonuclease VII small subunit
VPKAAPQSEQDGEPAFEDALRQLESIVEAMESDDLPLDQLLKRFEEGTRLAQLCQNRLSTAEVRIRKLEETLGGTLVAKPAALDSGDAA